MNIILKCMIWWYPPILGKLHVDMRGASIAMGIPKTSKPCVSTLEWSNFE